MKITVWKRHEVEFTDEELKRWKEDYDENPEDFCNPNDKNNFEEMMFDELIENYDFDIVINDNEGYSELCRKWNEM